MTPSLRLTTSNTTRRSMAMDNACRMRLSSKGFRSKFNQMAKPPQPKEGTR